jgi:hypothetical protein
MNSNVNKPPYDRSPLPNEARARLKPGYAGDPTVSDPFVRYPTDCTQGFQIAVAPYVAPV